jgi:hypothetical protein
MYNGWSKKKRDLLSPTYKQGQEDNRRQKPASDVQREPSFPRFVSNDKNKIIPHSKTTCLALIKIRVFHLLQLIEILHG